MQAGCEVMQNFKTQVLRNGKTGEKVLDHDPA
jgi:hypothetical protein